MASSDGGSYNNEPSVNLNEFQQLLDRLEGSKKRQQRQKSVEGRRDIYSQGMASMMSNFWYSFFHLKKDHGSRRTWATKRTSRYDINS